MKLHLVLTFSVTFFVCNCPAFQSSILGCDSRRTITVRESVISIMCSVQGKGVAWNLIFSNGTNILLGMCDSQNCMNNLPNVKIKWKNNTHSELASQFDTNWNDSRLLCGGTNFLSSCRIIMQSSGILLPSPSTRIYDESTSMIFSTLVSTYHSITKLRGTLTTASSIREYEPATSTAVVLIAGIIGFVMGTAVTVIVIAIIVFLLRRQRKRTSEDGANNKTTNALQLDNASQTGVLTANEGAYSALQMADVGLRSPYADFHIYRNREDTLEVL